MLLKGKIIIWLMIYGYNILKIWNFCWRFSCHHHFRFQYQSDLDSSEMNNADLIFIAVWQRMIGFSNMANLESKVIPIKFLVHVVYINKLWKKWGWYMTLTLKNDTNFEKVFKYERLNILFSISNVSVCKMHIHHYLVTTTECNSLRAKVNAFKNKLLWCKTNGTFIT